jgi:hypothetical protein
LNGACEWVTRLPFLETVIHTMSDKISTVLAFYHRNIRDWLLAYGIVNGFIDTSGHMKLPFRFGERTVYLAATTIYLAGTSSDSIQKIIDFFLSNYNFDQHFASYVIAE